MLPTSDHIAIAIVTACRECGADPAVLAPMLAAGIQRPPDRQGRAALSHARAYAALALRRAFPRCGPVYVSRMVAAGSPSVYLANLEADLAKSRLGWFQHLALNRVVAAIREWQPRQDDVKATLALPEPEPTTGHASPGEQPIDGQLADRPAAPVKLQPDRGGYVSLGAPAPQSKAALRDMLRRAVENTARMQKDG